MRTPRTRPVLHAMVSGAYSERPVSQLETDPTMEERGTEMTTSRRDEQDGSGIKGLAEDWPSTVGWMGYSMCDARGRRHGEARSHLQWAWRFTCKGDIWVGRGQDLAGGFLRRCSGAKRACLKSCYGAIGVRNSDAQAQRARYVHPLELESEAYLCAVAGAVSLLPWGRTCRFRLRRAHRPCDSG